MRYIKCINCGRQFGEDDDNPAIHYSEPAKFCGSQCKSEFQGEVLKVKGYEHLVVSIDTRMGNGSTNIDKLTGNVYALLGILFMHEGQLSADEIKLMTMIKSDMEK